MPARGCLATDKLWKPKTAKRRRAVAVVSFFHGPGAEKPDPCTKIYGWAEAEALERRRLI